MVHGGRGGGGGGSGGGVRLGLQLHLLEPTDLGGEPGAQLVVRTLHGAEPVAALQSREMKVEEASTVDAERNGQII